MEITLIVDLLQLRQKFGNRKHEGRLIRPILVIGNKPGLKALAISRQLRIAKQSQMRALGPLVRKGIAVKDKDKRYYLTVYGQELYDQISPLMEAILDDYRRAMIKRVIR